MFHVDVVRLKRGEQKSIRDRYLEKIYGKNTRVKKHLKRKTGQTLQLTPKTRRGSDFYFILVLLVLAKKVGQIGAVIRTCFDILSYVSFGATRCLSIGLSVHASVSSSVHHTHLKICKLCISVVSPTFTWHFYISLLNITKY